MKGDTMTGTQVRLWTLASVACVVGLLAFSLADRLILSLGSVDALRALFVDKSYAEAAERQLRATAIYNPNSYWILGMLAHAQGDEAARRAAFEALLVDNPDRIALLAIVAAEDVQLAQRALALYPQRAETLAWRARQLEAVDPKASVEIYRRVLSLSPTAYEWWLGLGRAYESMGDDPNALIAFEEACTLATGILPCAEVQRVRQRLEVGAP
jgi:tetratricopeptide (TPR) repeat protein